MNIKGVQLEKGRKYFGDSWMEKRDDLYLLHLKGSPYEIGYQHGILMNEEIKTGAVSFYADPINGGRISYSPLNFLIKAYLNKKVYRPIEKTQPKAILEQLKGISDGSGLSYKKVFKGNHHTAVSMVMTPILIKNNLKKFNQLGIDIGACSTFVATNKATSDGKIIIGRNTDYPGIEGWSKYQTVTFVEPTDGFNYVQIGTAGVILWAPGMNAKGIVVCGHYMIYDDITPNGWTIPAFTDAILRYAETIEDAKEILKSNPRGVSCGFVIIDGKTSDAIAAEVSSGKVTFREMEKIRIIMTNMAISEEKRKIDYVSKFNLNEGCPARYQRLMQLIDENYGRIDISLAAEFMGDHIRYPIGVERTAYGIVAVDDNVNSIIFSPEDLKFWVAAGPAPVCNNIFIGFDFKEEIGGNPSKINPEILEGYKFKNPNKRLAMQKFQQAYILFEKNPKKVSKILQLIREALKLDLEEVIYYQMIAKYLLHQKKYAEAIEIAKNTINLKQSLNELAHNNLLLGILNDLDGNREKAISYYRQIENLVKRKPKDSWFEINKVIDGFAKKYLKNPFGKKQLKDRSVLISFAQDSGIE